MVQLDWHPPKINPVTVVFFNTADHAPSVHEGASTWNGGTIAARPYMTGTVNDGAGSDLVHNIAEGFKQYNGDLTKAVSEASKILHDEFIDAITQPIWEYRIS